MKQPLWQQLSFREDLKNAIKLSCLIALCMTCLLSCNSSASETKPVVLSVEELGVIGQPESVTARDGGASVKLGDMILWTFSDTIFSPASEDGSNLRTNTAAYASLTNPLETNEPLDPKGAPLQAIPFNTEELNFNESNQNERIALWPGGLLAQDKQAFAFVHKLKVRSGTLNYEHLSVELAEFTQGQTLAKRTARLFGPDEPIFLSPLVQDAYVYLYGLIEIDGSKGVGVARAVLGKQSERTAYEVWDGTNWVTDFTQVASLFKQVPGAVSVSWNQHLEHFIAIHSLALSNKVVMRTSSTPQGPWSEPIDLFEAEAPETGVNYAGEQHPELAKQKGQTIFVSYYHPLPGFIKGELRLVEVSFE